MAGKQRELRRAMGKPFERGETVGDRELADRVHPGMNIERGKPRPGVANFGDSQADLVPHGRKRIGRHNFKFSPRPMLAQPSQRTGPNIQETDNCA